MVKIYTSRIGYQGKDGVDTTVKNSRGDCLAPTWDLVAGHKLYTAMQQQNHAEIARWSTDKFSKPITPLDDEAYTAKYLSLLRERYVRDKQPFLNLLQQDQVTLTCYCAPGQFCHRHIAADVLGKIASRHDIPFERGGELDPHTGRRWLDAKDPQRRDLQLEVVSLRDGDTAADRGFAVVGLVTSPRNLNLYFELGHFRAASTAGDYARELETQIKERELPIDGAKEDVLITERFLKNRARELGHSGEVNYFLTQDWKDWQQGVFSVKHGADEIRYHPDEQSVRFGVLPLKSTDGRTQYGWSATAMVEQSKQHALMEIAHFALGAEQRSHEYVDELEMGLIKGGYALEGKAEEMKRTVEHLTERAWANRLPGDWLSVSDAQVERLEAGDLGIAHNRNEIKMLSRVPLELDEIEL